MKTLPRPESPKTAPFDRQFWSLRFLVFLALGVWCLEFPLPVCAQGPLTPPGAPTPSMKSLDQIEARTPISSSPFTISTSGSYYLTKNLTVSSGNAITVNASDVVLDLNGFTISSTAGSPTGAAILIGSGLANITVVNGAVQSGVTESGGTYSGTGFANGISFSGTISTNVRVIAVVVLGTLNNGIYLGHQSVAESCQVKTVGGTGIFAGTVKNCLAFDCASVGIDGGVVSDSWGETGTNSNSYGISANTASNSYGNSTGGYGLAAINAQNCYGHSGGSGYGINAFVALNCYASSNSSIGIYAYMVQNSYGTSSGTSNTDDGVDAAFTAENCYGVASNGMGVAAGTALNCFGYSANGNGINANAAMNCVGESVNGIGVSVTSAAFCLGSRPGGTAIAAAIANGCYAVSGTNSITNQYNMP